MAPAIALPAALAAAYIGFGIKKLFKTIIRGALSWANR